MKRNIIALLMCLIAISVMGQGIITRQKPKTTTTQKKTVNRKKTTPVKKQSTSVTKRPKTTVTYDPFMADSIAEAPDDDNEVINITMPVQNYGFNLEYYLDSPMNLGNTTPEATTPKDMKKQLNKAYKVDDRGDKDYYMYYIWKNENSEFAQLSYHDIPINYFLCVYNKDKTLSRYSYVFETYDKSTNMFRILDKIVKDFNEIGIPIKYSKTKDKFTKAHGDIAVGKCKYAITYDEYSVSKRIQIDKWYLK